MSHRLDLGIAVPTLNCVDTLWHTLAALQPLRRQGAQVAVVDSFSTDGTYEYACKEADVVLQVPQGNLYEAVNQGLRSLKAGWLGYINGDDLLYADAVAAAVANAEPKTDVLYGNADFIDYSGRFLHSWRPAPPRDFPALASQLIMPIMQMGLLFRRRVFDQLGGFDTQFRLSADFDFVLRACLAGCCFQRQAGLSLGAFRLHAKQISQSFQAEMLKEGDRSVAARSLQPTRWQQIQARVWFRLRNGDNYVIRLLRARALHGRWAVPTTLQSHTNLPKPA